MDCTETGQTAALRAPGRRRLEMEHLWALAVLVCIWAFVATHPIRPHDFWWHLEIGREVVQTAHIPTDDRFSYTVEHGTYFSYQIYWLAEAMLYLVYQAGGAALSVFAHSLLITLTYGLVLGLCWKLSGSGRIAALCTLAAAACGFENWNVRPQAITFLLATVYLWQIYEWRRKPERSAWQLAWFPGLMMVWVNCHGSFPLGLALIGLWLVEALWGRWVGKDRRSLLAPLGALVLTALAMAVGNPAQWLFLVAYLREMANNEVVQRLPEWAPASLVTKDGIAFFVTATLSAVALGVGWRRVRLFHVLSFVCFALLAWKTGRAIVWFGLATAPVLAEVLPGLLKARGQESKAPDRAEGVINAVLAVGLLAVVVVTMPWLKDRLPLPEQKAGLVSVETPVAATEYLLEHHLPAQVFHEMGYGSYLIWAAQPNYRVFADPRIELYPERVWQEYDALSAGEAGWEARLARHGVSTLMLDRDLQARLVAKVERSAAWREVYRDRRTVLFVRVFRS